MSIGASTSRVIVFLSLTVLGCKTAASHQTATLQDADPGATPAADCSQSLSYVGQAAVQELSNQPNPVKFWELSCNNLLAPNWLILTPPAQYWETPFAQLPQRDNCDTGNNCDTDMHVLRCQSQSDCTRGVCTQVNYSTSSVCAGHSDTQYSVLYDLVSSANKRVDISTLGAPDWPYVTMFRRAFEAAANRINRAGTDPGPIDLRVLGTGTVQEGTNLDVGLAQNLLTLQKPWLRISTGMHGSPISWNHSKVVVVDGTEAIVGGHNWWSGDYNRDIPLFDVSMRLRGRAARAAQHYIEWLWSSPAYVKGASLPSKNASDATLPPFTADNADSVQGTLPVLAIGTDGGFARGTRPGASDIALYKIIDAAHQTIAVSQMELVSPPAPTGFAYQQFLSTYLLDHLGAALARGVDIYVVISSDDKSDAVSASYSHGWPMQRIATAIKQRILATQGTALGGDAGVSAKLCSNFHLAYIRRSDAEELNLNHAKVMIIDDAAFYIGSQNLYPGGMADNLSPQLAEFGFLVDDKATTAQFTTTYWNAVWKHSQRTDVSGATPLGGQCAFLADQ